jgi:NAD(P)-dependent dehydrogenase (short-subunit alcohol dehydrogenase family)
MKNKFVQKRAFITGAGSGLGRALCLELAKRRWRIAVADVDRKRIEETASLIRQQGGQALEIICDVTRPEDLEHAAAAVKEAWGGVDVVINNAGVSAYGDMETIPVERWQWIININLMGVIYGCKAFIPVLEAQGGGHVVNIASYLAFLSAPGSTCYNVTKAGILSLSETLRIELAGKNIGVSVVMPSFFKTNLMDQLYCTDSGKEKMIRTLFSRSSFPAAKIAANIIRAMEKNRFYVLPQWDARLLWSIKRWMPGLYLRLFAFVYRKGYINKVLGV